MQPIESRVHVNGVDLCLFEWPGEGRPILLVHATGFHARCWDQVAANLPGRHVYAVDMRGHGRSSRPAPPYPWHAFGEDVAALVRALHFTDTLAVGHSMGGHSITLAASIEPAAFGALLLVDPVIMSAEGYARNSSRDQDHFSSRRRNEWASADEMFERFKDRPPFSGWDPAVLHDYCDFGVVPSPTGQGYELACPPAIEAAVYAGSAGDNIYGAIATIDIPVRILRARTRQEGEGAMDMSASPTAPDLASHFRHAEDFVLPQYSHFIPMEGPAFVAEHIRELADR